MAESFGENYLEKGLALNYQNYKTEKIIYSKPFILGFMTCPRLHH